MKICKSCGCKLPDDVAFCTECGTKYIDESAQEKPAGFGNAGSEPPHSRPESRLDRIQSAKTAASETASKAAQSMNNLAGMIQTKKAEAANFDIALAEGEVIVKRYHATNVFFPPVAGYLTITNKRIIFRSGSSFSKIMMSCPIMSVGNIQVYSGWIFRLILFLIFMAGLYLVATGVETYSYWYYDANLGSLGVIGVLMMLIGGYFMLRRSIFLSISAFGGTPGIVVGKSNTLGASFYAISGTGGQDIDKIMNEIGAIVLDFQQMGDAAIEKWKQ